MTAIRIVWSGFKGPEFIEYPSIVDAFEVVIRWCNSCCANGPVSVWRLHRGRWVPLFPDAMQPR